MEAAIVIAVLGWLLALIQFVFNFRENQRKNEDELLEKTLGYFERGTVARSMGISLVDGIWYRRKRRLEVIVPVLVSQLNFLLTEAEDYAHESRNLIRLLTLIEKCMPYGADPSTESLEVAEMIISAAIDGTKIPTSKPQLRLWYSKFSNGDTEWFDAETADT